MLATDRMQYEISRMQDELDNAYLQLKTQRENESKRTHLLIDALGWEKYKQIVNPENKI